MAKSEEDGRREHAEKTAKAARQKELDRRAAIREAQAKAQRDVYRPLVTSGG